MLLKSLLRRPLALSGILAIGAAVGLSSFGIVRAERGVQPAKNNVTCNKSGSCVNITNDTGSAETLTASGADARALFVSAPSSGADGTDITGGYIGVIGRSADYPLVLTNSSGDDEDYTDASGDIYYAGSLEGFAKTRGGERVVSYGCQATTNTLEDVGSGHLTNGMAFVRLHRTFADSIELQADPYRVFLTPNGDSRGLYIAQKTTNGFVVRESERGRSTLDFDYRVVATSLGHAGERMGVTPLSAEPKAATSR